MKRKLLGERLLESGLIREQELAQALQAQQSTGEQLGQLLIRLGYLQEGDLFRHLCEDAGISFSVLNDVEVDPAALSIVPEELARAGTLLPLREEDGRLTVALADPFDIATITSLERTTRRRATVIGAPRTRILEVLDRVYRDGNTPAPRRETGDLPAGDTAVSFPVTQDMDAKRDEAVGTAAGVVNEVLQKGISLGATDIHIEPTEDAVQVRYRLDGILRGGSSLPKSLQAAVLTRIKVSAGMDIAEGRLPQDGRLRVQTAGREIDLRISTFPTLHGEDMVLRVLDRGRVSLQLERLGLGEADLTLFRDVLRRPHGLILITGPTGSGKTTTLYSALAEMNTGERCILTLEDPIEYEVEGIRQAQINPRAGLTFASGLRSMLRHDPDVILVGEVRDKETAEIGLSAAMTGHMVLTTLHTNTAAGAIPRLLDMGIEPFALASSLQLSVAQRLVRVLCRECRQSMDVPSVVRRRFRLDGVQLYRPTGCAACNQTGYRGRIAVFEILPVTEETAAAIYSRESAEEIQRRSGRPNLLQAGLEKVRAGTTSLEELLRIVSA
jgi:type IV pilus assembly protein PilB